MGECYCRDVMRLGPEGSSGGYKVNREGTWADSDLEKALRSLLSFAKSYKSKFFPIFTICTVHLCIHSQPLLYFKFRFVILFFKLGESLVSINH